MVFSATGVGRATTALNKLLRWNGRGIATPDLRREPKIFGVVDGRPFLVRIPDYKSDITALLVPMHKDRLRNQIASPMTARV